MTEPTLDKLERLLAAGTPGEWKISQDAPGHKYDDVFYVDVNRYWFAEVHKKDNAELIAAAVNNLPKLIAVARALKADPKYFMWASTEVLEALAALDEGES